MKSWVKRVFGFGVASFFSDFSHEMTISFIPIIVAQLVGATNAPYYLGIIAAVSGFFASIVRIFSGYVADRTTHKKPLIALGYALASLFSMLLGFAHTIGGVLTCRMLSFAGSGLREPARDALLASSVQPIFYGRAFGLRSAMDTLGSLIGPLIAFWCVSWLSMQTIFVLSFIPGILAMFSILFLTTEVATTQKKSVVSITFFKQLSRLPKSFLIFLIILVVFDMSNFNKLLLLTRTQEIIIAGNYSVAQLLVLLYALFNFSRACSEFLIGLLSDYVSRVLLLALCGCGFFALVAFLLIEPHASVGYCAGIFVLAGMSAAATLTLKKACAADMLLPDILGIGYGVMQATEGLSLLISNIVIGYLWTQYSPWLGFMYVVVLSLIAMVLLIGFASCAMFLKLKRN